MPTYYQSDIVDDSEPEREELRQRQRSAPKVDSRNVKAIKATLIEVIEITDDESGNAAQNMAMFTETADLGPRTRVTRERQVLTAHKADFPGSNVIFATRASPACSTHALTSVADVAVITPNIPSPTALDAADSDHEDEDANVNFARFAYRNTTSSTAMPRSNHALSRQSPGVSSTTDARPLLKKRLTHRFTADFSDFELAKLAKCVSCDVHWTARKTATQKMVHVQSCAKKNSFSDDTIRILIRKEIDSRAPDTSSKGKRKAAESIPVDPETFLAEVVADSVPRKKGRRPEARETVQNIAQTRDFILDKARAVIGATSLGNVEDQEASLHTQAVEIRDLDLNSTILPSTQAFKTSALAQRHQKATSGLFGLEAQETSHSEESETEISPAATFAPSKLGAVRPPAYDQLLQSPVLSYINVTDSREAVSVNCIPDSVRAVSPINVSDNSSTGDISCEAMKKSTERMEVSSRGSASLILERDENDTRMFHNRSNDSNEFRWDNDDAYLHFDPGRDDLTLAAESIAPPISSTSSRTVQQTIAVKAPRPRTPRTQKGSPTKTKGLEPAVSKKNGNVTGRAKTPSKKRMQVEDESDEVWEMNMREKIIRDTNLYLRILRYEPIHFDVFLQIAGEGTSSSGKSKLRIRSFLDRQAIHFYGAEPSTGRGRR